MLAEDSRNVVELIENAYRSIAETIQVRNGTTSNLRIVVNATCPKQTLDGQCTGVSIGTEATYDISVELLDCSPIPNDQNLRFIFYGDILIEVEPVCSCECSSQPDLLNSFCNNETLICGQCFCNGRQGSKCECPSSQNTFANNELCLRTNNSEVVGYFSIFIYYFILLFYCNLLYFLRFSSHTYYSIAVILLIF